MVGKWDFLSPSLVLVILPLMTRLSTGTYRSFVRRKTPTNAFRPTPIPTDRLTNSDMPRASQLLLLLLCEAFAGPSDESTTNNVHPPACTLMTTSLNLHTKCALFLLLVVISIGCLKMTLYISPHHPLRHKRTNRGYAFMGALLMACTFYELFSSLPSPRPCHHLLLLP